MDGPREETRVWGNGAAFDNVILRRAYERTSRESMKAPWPHWNDRCYRTIKGLYGHQVKIERTGTHHHALDDAASQARHLIRMLNPSARMTDCIKGLDCTISTGYCSGCCS